LPPYFPLGSCERWARILEVMNLRRTPVFLIWDPLATGPIRSESPTTNSYSGLKWLQWSSVFLWVRDAVRLTILHFPLRLEFNLNPPIPSSTLIARPWATRLIFNFQVVMYEHIH